FLEEAERAIALNPNNPSVLADLGTYLVFTGEIDRGRDLVGKAMVLNPKHPDWYYGAITSYHYQRGEYEESLSTALKMDMPGFYWIEIWRAMNYGQLNRVIEAQETVSELLRLHPTLAEAYWETETEKMAMSERLAEHVAEGLRKAGLEIPESTN
ncbi:MAG: hypothetical protein QGF53_08395, partial [Alphaproteobacteria bacterium]|nr:hypothetical protein [Alphaproteobacteria bacterium]